jgi:hypothetical protein
VSQKGIASPRRLVKPKLKRSALLPESQRLGSKSTVFKKNGGVSSAAREKMPEEFEREGA